MSERIFILNRSAPIATGGWIHIVPSGELYNADAQITQVLDDKSLDSILANWAADKERLGDNWPGVYGGEEHFIYQPDQSSAAFAWFKDFQKRDDGIWASDEGLTDLGRQAVQNQRFKFTSFCADPSDLEQLGNNRVRILKVETIGFTNQANGKELLTPITNRRMTTTQNQEIFMTRQQAFDKKSAHAKTIRNRLHCSPDKAWEIAAEELPEVEKIICDVPSKPSFDQMLVEGRISNRLKAERDFSTQAIAYQRRTGVPYAAAREVIRNREPELYNRATGASDVQARDEAIITRAVEIVGQKPGITLRAALDVAGEEMPSPSTTPGSPEYLAHAEKVGNRALEILRANPNLRPHGAVKKAQSEMMAVGSPVTNRAQADADMIFNRAAAIRREMPGTSLATSVIMAENEAKGPASGTIPSAIAAEINT